MNVSDEAVEAAAKAHYGASKATRPWDEIAPMVRRIGLKKMRAALEAAAPHLMAPFVAALKVERQRVELLLELQRKPGESAEQQLSTPRPVATVEQLDELPEGAMVRTDAGFYLKEALRHGVSTWVTTNEQYYFKTNDIPLPATVIYEPEQRRSAGVGG